MISFIFRAFYAQGMIVFSPRVRGREGVSLGELFHARKKMIIPPACFARGGKLTYFKPHLFSPSRVQSTRDGEMLCLIDIPARSAGIR